MRKPRRIAIIRREGWRGIQGRECRRAERCVQDLVNNEDTGGGGVCEEGGTEGAEDLEARFVVLVVS